MTLLKKKLMRKKTEEQECLKKKSQAGSCEMGTVFFCHLIICGRTLRARLRSRFSAKYIFFIALNFIVYTAHERDAPRRCEIAKLLFIVLPQV